MFSAPFGSATSSLKERPRSQRANKPTSQRTAWPRPAADACQVQKERVLRCVECLVWTNLKKIDFLVGPLCTGKVFFAVLSLKRTCMKQFRLVNCNSLRPNPPFAKAFVVTCAWNIAQEVQLCLGCKALPRLLRVLWMYFVTNRPRIVQFVHFW